VIAVKKREFLEAVVATLACAPALAAPAAAATDPWTRVPALPTACYQSQDPWWDKNNAAIDAVQKDHYAQDEINGGIRQSSVDAQSADPMAVAQRMQQAMMNDPQNAKKMMEQMVQRGQQVQTEVPAQSAKEQQLEGESKTVIKQYQAALAKAMGPADARWTALKKKMGIAMDSPSPGEGGVPDWAWAEWGVILKERDQAYLANCAQWWAAAGPMHAYMKRYKDYLVLERTPFHRKIDDATLQSYQMQGVSTEGYRTTTDYEAAEDYMKMASSLFRERQAQPRCQADGNCN
jgi:hypothetical protein